MRKLVHRRRRRNGTGFHERLRPTEYARRLIKEYGMTKAERVAAAGEKSAKKGHGGWFSAVYDATQTIKHSRAYNPRKRTRKYSRRKARRSPARRNPRLATANRLKIRSYLRAVAANYGN